MTTKATEPKPPEVSPFTDTLKICAYGQYGSRKTLQIGSLIEMVGQDKVLIVSAEHGLNTIRSKVRADMVVSVSNLTEMREAWQKAKEFAAPDRWVCIDGSSQVVEWLANEQLGGADQFYDASKTGSMISKELQPFGRFISRGEINTMAVYGRIGRDSERLLSAWIGLPANIYATYLEDKTGSSGFEKTLPYGPDVPGRVGLKAVMSSFDYVMRLFYDDKGEITAGLDPASNVYMARTREDRTLVEIPREIHKFDLADFVRLVQGDNAKTAVTTA